VAFARQCQISRPRPLQGLSRAAIFFQRPVAARQDGRSTPAGARMSRMAVRAEAGTSTNVPSLVGRKTTSAGRQAGPGDPADTFHPRSMPPRPADRLNNCPSVCFDLDGEPGVRQFRPAGLWKSRRKERAQPLSRSAGPDWVARDCLANRSGPKRRRHSGSKSHASPPGVGPPQCFGGRAAEL
jgi:hypothetical protein